LQRVVKRFNNVALLAVISVFVVILAGGIVRSSGSGMGCPDWPKCFGSWVPPTEEAQLPVFYEKVYLEKRLAKNKRIAHLFQTLGFTELAGKLLTDPSVFQEQPFNALKTWIEYINRLVGVLIGLFIIGTFVLSVYLWSFDKWITILSGVSVVLVAFIGWVGSIVVSANLMPFTVTLHMVLAVLLVGLLIFIKARSGLYFIKPAGLDNFKKVWYISWLVCGLVFLQLLLGTQVREQVDLYLQVLNGHAGIIEELGLVFYVHRSFSIVVTGLIVYLAWLINYSAANREIKRSTQFLFVILVLEILAGVGMAYMDIPASLQPLHLTLGSLMVGIALHISISIGVQYYSIKSE
jgi:heme a synthase